jgi:hypothetical protein
MWLWCLFVIEVLVNAAVSTPRVLALDFWALGDSGANLTAHYLLTKGYRPAVDFGYPYGLLPLVFERLWFGLWGASPASCWAAMLVCEALIALGLARFCLGLRLGWYGVALIALTIPISIMPDYSNLANAMEAAAIANALAQLAWGRRRHALVWAVLAIFCKPAMGYFLGLALLCGMIVQGGMRSGASVRQLIGDLVPAGLVATAIAVALTAIFGLRPLVDTLLPLSGMRAYRAAHFSFFGEGRNFWAPGGVRWTYYVGTEAGFWIAATVLLLSGAVACAVQGLRLANFDDWRRRALEVVLTCAVLHLAFIAVLWPKSWDWFYYAYVLTMGVAALAAFGRMFAVPLAAVCVLALAGQKVSVQALSNLWHTTTPSADTGGLWASADERSEWRAMMNLAQRQGDRAIVMSHDGAAPLLFPGFVEPVSFFLYPGIPLGGEIAREAASLDGARLVVFPKSQELAVDRGVLARWPQEHPGNQVLRQVWRGEFFEAYAWDGE